MPSSLKSIITGSLTSSIETIEIRTRFSPPIVLKVSELLAEGPPSPVVQAVKPTIILNGSIGRQVIAPAGQSGVNDWKVPTLVLAGVAFVGATVVLGTIFQLGRRSGRRNR